MPTLANYIDGFFGIGSKAKVKQNQKDLLERLLSYEPQVLSAVQIVQVLMNLGLTADSFGKSNTLALTKGTHTITFKNAFIAPYSGSAQGTTSTGAGVNVIVLDDSNLASMILKVTADCTVRWSARLITET